MVNIKQDLPRFMRVKGQIDRLVEFYASIPGIEEMVVAEVGSFAGESSEIAAQFVKHLHCIDVWFAKNFVGDSGMTSEEVFDARMERFKNIKKIKSTGDEAATKFKLLSLDMVYIDAKHKFDQVLKDIALWSTRVKSDGYIAGHDYSNNPLHAGVKRAVDLLLSGLESFKHDKEGNWIVKKRDFYVQSH